MILSPNRYRMTYLPTLPEELVEIDFPFIVFSLRSGSSSDMGFVCSGIAFTPTEIYYILADPDTDESPIQLVYSEGKWLSPGYRSLLVPSEVEMEEEPYSYLSGQFAKAPEDMEIINFKILDRTFEAPKNISWLAWINGQAITEDTTTIVIASPLDTVLIGGIYELNLNGEIVSTIDTIQEGAEYTITPQIPFSITIPDKVNIDYSKARLNLGGYLLVEGDNEFSINTLEDYYLEDVPLTQINEQVSYSITNHKLVITVQNLPTNATEILEQEEVNLILPKPVKKFLTPLATGKSEVKNGVKITEQILPYKVKVSGSHYLGNPFNIKSELNIEGEAVFCGAVFPTLILDLMFAQSQAAGLDKYVASGLDLLTGMIASGEAFEQTESLLILGDLFLDYCNKKVRLEEMTGEYYGLMENNPEEVRNTYIAMMAKEKKVTVEEMLASLEAAAAEAEITVEEHITALLEEEFKAPFDSLRTLEFVEITEDNLYLVELWAEQIGVLNPKFGDFETSWMITTMIGTYFGAMCLLYMKEEGSIDLKYTFSTEDSREFLLEEGGEIVLSDFKQKQENNFEFIGGTSGSAYLTVGSYTPPVNRSTPGSVSVRIQCLSGDTLITLASGEKKRLDKIDIGEKILTTSGVEAVVYSDAKMHKVRNCYKKYYLSNGIELTVIKNHRVYSVDRKRFVRISDIKENERILLENGEYATIIKQEQHQEPIKHYTIFTENSNAYFANGIVCGNSFSNIKNVFLRKKAIKLFSWLCQKGGV